MSINQELKCPVCNFTNGGQENFKYLYHYKQWDLYECPECTFQFWWPLGQASREFFEGSSKNFADILVKPTLDPRHKLILKLMPIKTGAVLDIGCGDKLLLPGLDRRGFDVWGVDFNRRVIEKDKKLFGLKNLYPLSIYDFALLPNLPKFDLITFFEVLEHIENPKKFILTIKNRLNNKGFIALSVPDVKMFDPWDYLANIVPYHTAYWTPETLKIFLIKNNFKIITMRKINRPDVIAFLINTLIKLKLIKKSSLASAHHNGVGIKYNNLQTPLYNFPLLKKVIVFLLRITLFPLREFLYILGFRPTIFVIARAKN